MNQLEVFKNREFGQIRTVTVDGEPWFVGKDIAEALGYKNTKDAILTHVMDEDKKIFQRSELATLENHIPKSVLNVKFVDANFPNRGLCFINESGMYALVFGSKLESAKRFKHWVTSEVLPQIRTTGTYQKPMTLQEMMRVQLGMIDGHEERITHLENTMTIDYGQQQDLRKAVNKRVIEVLGGKGAPAYRALSKKVFAECNHDIQDYFGVNSRNNIPVMRYEEAVTYVDGWNPGNNTILEIRSCNAGMGGEWCGV